MTDQQQAASNPEKTIDLSVANPDPSARPGTSFFGVRLPLTCTEDDFDAMIDAIEFRRKCHNQGFDNLIEWINMSRKNLLAKKEEGATDAT